MKKIVAKKTAVCKNRHKNGIVVSKNFGDLHENCRRLGRLNAQSLLVGERIPMLWADFIRDNPLLRGSSALNVIDLPLCYT